jgi:hypothetical protein
MRTSAGAFNKQISLSIALGAVGIACCATLYALSKNESLRFLLAEGLKALLAFTFVAVGGALFKAVLDEHAETRTRLETKADQWQEERKDLIRETASIFSEFYSLRKLYDSHSIEGTLQQSMLRESVDLEGRYGALKVQALIHLGLPLGDFGYKPFVELRNAIDSERDPKMRRRLWFDYLGEAFDGWRHAIVKGKAIDRSAAAWEAYE